MERYCRFGGHTIDLKRAEISRIDTYIVVAYSDNPEEDWYWDFGSLNSATVIIGIIVGNQECFRESDQ
jgi:hypothetical protein